MQIVDGTVCRYQGAGFCSVASLSVMTPTVVTASEAMKSHQEGAADLVIDAAGRGIPRFLEKK